MNELIKKIYEYGLIPVIKITSSDTAVPLARSLCSGGLPVAEITFRTDCAAESIKLIKDAFPNMLVGAGTVLTPEQADKAAESGADFIVSPGYNPRVVTHCIEKEITIIPGCSTPSDIEMAIEAGLDTVKFFPSEAYGGITTIKALSAPYSNIRFIPTGGIDEKNILSYLEFDKILACGGSFMVKESLINEGKFDEITALTRNAVKQILGLKLAHVGINCNGDSHMRHSAAVFAAMLGCDANINEGASSCFIDGMIELISSNGRGTHGHIALQTNFIVRAEAYFKRMGMKFDDDSRTYSADKKLKTVYFSDEISGFAFHLIQI